MRVLFVDYLSPVGHIEFNRIHVSSILKLGYSVSTIFRKGYYEKVGVKEASVYYEIPDKYYRHEDNRVIVRVNYVKILSLISSIVKMSEWDAVILSSFESISLCVSGALPGAYIINHNNIGDLKSKLKSFFYKRLSLRYTNVVFNDFLAQELKKAGVERSMVISHGCLDFERYRISVPFLRKIGLNIDSRIIFSPSSSSVDIPFIYEICQSAKLDSFLKRNDVYLVIKSFRIKRFLNKSCHIIILDNYLDSLDYYSLFRIAKSILLPYDSSFEYRVSGILFDCIANNKYCIFKDRGALNYYLKYFNYSNSHFCDLDEMIVCLQSSLAYDPAVSLYSAVEEIKDPSLQWKRIL